jgi:uncharacterized membrane protein YozB (DUF420 family)
MSLTDFPALNASLNATSAVLLLAGFGFIKNGKKDAHRLCMVLALAVSTVFLGCYLYYHFHAGHVSFTGKGWVRPLYFCILLSHTLLAVTVPFLAGITVVRALKGDFVRHKKIARITFPIWLYVSVTGVVVYLMLYQLYPATPGVL